MTQAREGLPFVTCTDFGEPGRVHNITYHATEDTAKRAWPGLVRIYGEDGIGAQGRLWIVERSTGRVLRDTGSLGSGYDKKGNAGTSTRVYTTRKLDLSGA